ncbi:Elongator complex protein 1, partial [Globisporangium splendens]
MVATRSASKSPTAAAVKAAASPKAAAKRPSSADSSKSPSNKKQATSPKAKKDFEVGKPATKDVALVNQDGDKVKFADTFKDHGVVFFMYPKANTPGCTKQACGFRDHIQEIKDAGFTVYGLSADSPKSLLNWKTKEKLSYDLLSDPKHELIKYFGSSIGGTKVQRSHVVILKDGIVGDIQGKVSPAESVERAVAFVTSNKQPIDGAAPAPASETASGPVAEKEEKKTTPTFAVGESLSLVVELLTHASEKVQVQNLFKERGVIFFMYPKADTPECTIQACGFNDNIKEINDAGFDVYGLGADTPEELFAWKQKQSYAYSFLSDPKHELIGYFGNSSNEGARVERSHVIILPGGKVGQIELKVAPKDSFTKALEFVKANAIANHQPSIVADDTTKLNLGTMRNLVSLRRRCWSLQHAAAAEQGFTAFALNADENQAFFLHKNGRIDVATLEEDDAQQELLADLQGLIPVDDAAVDEEDGNALTSQWRWMDYVAELDALVCANTNGTLAVIDVNARDGEEIGAMDGGIRGIAWSSNQEMVAVVTGVGTVLVMNTQWEVLYETQLDAFLPAGLSRMQPEGDNGSSSSEVAVCWREDSQYLVLNVPLVTTVGGKLVQKVMVFTGQLEFHALGRLEDGRDIPQLGAALDWCPNHSLIASSEIRKEQLFIVFFERNGLRHGEFALPAEYHASSYRVTQVAWNIESDILAVALEDSDGATQSVVQLWTRNNYHWYLKQERRLHLESKRLVQFTWDDELANKLHLLSTSPGGASHALLQEEFTWDASRGEREIVSTGTDTKKSIVVAGVIDGNKLLLTPLHQALVPPPFALHQVKFPAAVNSVVFDSQSEALIALLSDGGVYLVDNYLSSAEQTLLQGEEAENFTSLQWMHWSRQDRSLSLVAKSGWYDAVVLVSAESNESGELVASTKTPLLEGARRAEEIVNNGHIDSEDPESPRSIAIQTHDGTVYTVNPHHASPVPVEISDRYPAFAQFVVIAVDSSASATSQEDQGYLVVGLQTTSKLYVDDQLLASACSTFRYCPAASVLVFTTLGSQAQLRMVPLQGLRQRQFDVYESRTVERGAKLVAVIGDRANVVVQMPRGNLECMAPRLLVLALAVQQIEQLQYVAALEICRKHRLDLNLLVDFDSTSFLANFPARLIRYFLETKPTQITSDRLCLFITNLHPVDVWKTKYLPQVAPFIATSDSAAPADDVDKVNGVCQAIMAAIEELEHQEECTDATRSALLLPFLTSTVKQSPPQYDAALTKIQALLQSNGDSLAIAKRAMKHLILLTQVDVLFDEALGLYDLELVRFIATYSQRDPKEYVPFLDELARIESAELQKYTIDVHLQRFEKALVHLSALIMSVAQDADKKLKYEEDALALIKRGSLYDQALALFSTSSKASDVAKAFHKRILLLKGEHLEATNQHEAAAYVYLSVPAFAEAQSAFLAAGRWQMGLSLAFKAKKTPGEIQNLAYEVAQKLLGKQDRTVENVIAAARIYVEYCHDIDEAVTVLVANKQYEEAWRLAYLYKREDLIESDIESGVLQAYDEIRAEISNQSAAYLKHWTRLTTIREQKRLFKLHGIDGSRWQQDGDGDGANSVVSGAPSAADSALSNASMRSVGSHNSALSIGNFAMQTLAQATSSHFYATQTLGNAGTTAQKKKRLSRSERRNKIKAGSIDEEQHVHQQIVANQPSANMKTEVAQLLRMLAVFGQIVQAQTLQREFGAFVQRAEVEHPLPAVPAKTTTQPQEADAAETPTDGVSSPSSRSWRLAACRALVNLLSSLPTAPALAPRWMVYLECFDLLYTGYVAAVELIDRAKKASAEYYYGSTIETRFVPEEELVAAATLDANSSKTELDGAATISDVDQLGDKQLAINAALDVLVAALKIEFDDAGLLVKIWSLEEFCSAEDSEPAAPPVAADRNQLAEIDLCEKVPWTTAGDGNEFAVTELSFDDFCDAPAPTRC